MAEETRKLFDDMTVFYELIEGLDMPEEEKYPYFMGFMGFITSLTV